MKVSSSASHSLSQAQAQADAKNIKNQKATNMKSEIGANSSAQVSLSNQAQQIKKATEIAKDDSVDEAKIARLQSLIDGGKYKIDAAKIADKLVDEHLDMPS